MLSREILKSDLNLLMSLKILLEERSVTRAAERLHITQPAMSKTLSRLRLMFDDPLFTRSSHGMQPTPRAEALESQLSTVLADIEQMIGESRFDPARYEGEITLALSEFVGAALLPQLVQRLHQRAPRLGLRTITRVENQLEQLANGNLDFAIQLEQHHYGDAFRYLSVGTTHPVLLVRENHPLTREGPDGGALENYPVIRLYIPDLDQLNLTRDSELIIPDQALVQGYFETSHLLTALEVLRNTDYYMTAPVNLLENTATNSGIVALPLPGAERFRINYALVAHQRTARSAPHQWFWSQIVEALDSLRSAGDTVAY